MVTDQEVNRRIKEELRSRDCTCGRNYADVIDLMYSVSVAFPSYQRRTVEKKIGRLLLAPDYKRDHKGGVSLAEPECGTG